MNSVDDNAYVLNKLIDILEKLDESRARRLLYNLACDLYQDKKYKDALIIFKKLRDSNFSMESYENIAKCYLRLHNFREAGDSYIAYFDYIIKVKHPFLLYKCPDILLITGICYIISGDKAKYELVINNDHLGYARKQELINRKFSESNDPDIKYLIEYIYNQ